MVYAALAIACLALALSIYTAARARDATATDPGACVDPQAREQLAVLRRALAERDAYVAQLVRAAAGAGAGSAVAEAQPAVPDAPAAVVRPRYERFETPNPAVTVMQNADGTYDIRSTDPALAGSVMQVMAIGPSGEETPMYVRIPGP
jgi:hypothetical protein